MLDRVNKIQFSKVLFITLKLIYYKVTLRCCNMDVFPRSTFGLIVKKLLGTLDKTVETQSS